MEATRSQYEVIEKWLEAGTINFFGYPFAGKDYQATRLSEKFKGAVLGGGNILRNSVIPPEIKAEMDAGHLIPSESYVTIVLPYLSKNEFNNTPLFLSAVGRWHGEESGVIEALRASKHPLKAVVYLRLDKESVVARFHADLFKEDRGVRADDEERVLVERLKEFDEKTAPVIEFYRSTGHLIEIDASKSKQEVELLILEALASRASTSP